MQKILYIAPVFFELKLSSGVQKKISYQCDAFSRTFETFILCYDNDGIVLLEWKTKQKTIISKKKGGRYVVAFSRRLNASFDFVYIRYPLCSFSFLRSVRALSKSSKKITIEIATYPYEREYQKGLKNRCISLLDKLTRIFLKKYVNRIVTFSKDEYIFGIKTIVTINGVDFSKVGIAEYTNSSVLDLIAVSSVYYLHGYDRLINGLAHYYKNNGSDDIVLHIVGDGPYLNQYKELVNSNGINNHVIFYGNLFGDELDALYSKSLLAINSLAIHRQNLLNESTIKSKEYAAKGLPIMSSSFVDAFSEEDNNRFVFLVEPNDEQIDIESMLSFIHALYDKHSITDVRKRIRSGSISVCDINVTMQPIIMFFSGEE